MPRSSRHKSHKAHKHGSRDARDRSETDDDGGSRDRKQKLEDSGTKISKDPESEKRKSSSSLQLHRGSGGQVGPDGGDLGKKRKDRVDDLTVTDRWVGGGEDDDLSEKGPKSEAFGAVDMEKAAKSKLLSTDSKGRSSRRLGGSTERHEESGDKVEPPKHRPEKDSTKKESSGQYKDAKEKDRERGLESDKEHGLERVKNIRNSRNERYDDKSSRNQSGKAGSSEAERAVKKDKENAEGQTQDELHNPDLEKELEKRVRRRDGSEDKDRYGRESDDRRCRDSDDRRLSSRDDRVKNGSYRDERHKDERNRDGRYSRDKYREDLCRDHRHRDDRHSDEHSSKNRASDRYHGNHTKDVKPLDSHHKKSKLQDSDHNSSPYVEDHGTKFKDARGRKRSSDENEEHKDMKLECTKQPRGDVGKNSSNPSKSESHMDRARPEYRHPDKVDFGINDSHLKSSTSCSSHAVKDENRHSSKQGEFTCRKSPSQERRHSNASFTGDHAGVSEVHERDSESQSKEKSKPKEHNSSGELLKEVTATPRYDRTPKSDGQNSLVSFTEKSPSSSDRRFSNKSGARRSLDSEDVGQISSRPMDGRDCSTIDDKERRDNHSQTELQDIDRIPVGSSFFSRPAHFSGSSPGHGPPPIRPHSSPVLGSFEEDRRHSTGDRNSNSRYKRNGDYNTRRAQGNTWRSASPWPSVANGFIPFQHGPPPPGFHSPIQQFPFPSLFGIRPSMDMNHAADRFSNHGRPFGLCSPLVDSFQPQLQGWDRSNGVFGDEWRSEWDQNRQLMGSRGWDKNVGMWKGQEGHVNMEFPVPQKEPEYSSHSLTDDAWLGQSGHMSHTERARLEPLLDERTEIKQSTETSVEHAVEALPNTVHEMMAEPSKTTSDDGASFCCTYLSKLDISLDLTCPELYKQCITLLGTKDPPDESNSSKKICTQNVKEDTKATKSSSYILNRLCPKKADVVFQRAMLVYKKQNKATKVKVPVLPISPVDEQNLPDAPDTETVKSKTSGESSQSNASSATNIEEEGHTVTDPEAAVISDTVVPVEGLPMEEKNPSEAPDTEKVKNYQISEERPPQNSSSDRVIEDDVQVIADADADATVPSGAMEQKSGLISDAVVFVEGSEECEEAIMPECTVDLSRIPNYPGSTH